MDQHTEGLTRSYDLLLSQFDEATEFCRSLGLGHQLADSRFAKYHQRLEHLSRIAGPHNPPTATIDDGIPYLVAMREIIEFVFLLPFLRVSDQRTVRVRMEKILAGPELSGDEDAGANSNEPRNIQFELYWAALLFRGGLRPVLGKRPDLTCEVNGQVLGFECKRVFEDPNRVSRQINRAAKQLQDAQGLTKPLGVIVVSVSRAMNPQSLGIRVPNERTASEMLAKWLEGIDSSPIVAAAREDFFAKRRACAVLYHASSLWLSQDSVRYSVGSRLHAHAHESRCKAELSVLARAVSQIEY